MAIISIGPWSDNLFQVTSGPTVTLTNKFQQWDFLCSSLIPSFCLNPWNIMCMSSWVLHLHFFSLPDYCLFLKPVSVIGSRFLDSLDLLCPNLYLLNDNLFPPSHLDNSGNLQPSSFSVSPNLNSSERQSRTHEYIYIYLIHNIAFWMAGIF